MEKILDLGDGYRMKATRRKVGNFTVVAVDWEHPNYGYFADAMVWVRSMHMSDWKRVPVVNWSRKYGDVEDFLEDYPEFSEFFEYSSSQEYLESMFGGGEDGDDRGYMVP